MTMCETPFWIWVARPIARGRQRRMFLLGPLSTVALLMKSASRSCPGFFTFALDTALSITLRRTGAPALGVNSRSCSASVASLPRTRFAIIRALRGEMRACIALALAIIGRPSGGREPRPRHADAARLGGARGFGSSRALRRSAVAARRLEPTGDGDARAHARSRVEEERVGRRYGRRCPRVDVGPRRDARFSSGFAGGAREKLRGRSIWRPARHLGASALDEARRSARLVERGDGAEIGARRSREPAVTRLSAG